MPAAPEPDAAGERRPVHTRGRAARAEKGAPPRADDDHRVDTEVVEHRREDVAAVGVLIGELGKVQRLDVARDLEVRLRRELGHRRRLLRDVAVLVLRVDEFGICRGTRRAHAFSAGGKRLAVDARAGVLGLVLETMPR